MDEYFKGISKYNLWDGNDFPLGIDRQVYTEKIKPFLGSKLIKVLVGQRRSGKSFLMKQLAMQLVNDYKVPRANILYVNMEFLEFDFIETYKDLEALFQHYKKTLQPKGKIYLFIDEVQNILGWEKFVNAHAQGFVDEAELFVTGSNSTLLSGELATLLSGRYINFLVLPFDYQEYLTITNKQTGRATYLDYINFGGLPELFHLSQELSQKQYVLSVKDTILLRDIAQRNKVRDINLLNDLFIYLVNNASKLLSITNLVNYFKSKKRTSSYETIAQYIGYLEDTFLVHKCERFNIKGKETISGNAKYYLNDLAFKNLLFSGFGYGMGYLLENRIYLDLMNAGYKVYTGNLEKLEVDFIALKDGQVLYIQCAYLLESEETINREYTPLEKINDNYDKWVVTLDDIQLPSNKGIKHIQAWQLMDYL